MLTYHCSVRVRALEAKATVHPSCRSAAPSPFFDATWTVTGFQMSKYQSVVYLQTNFLIWLKDFWYVGFHMNSESFFSGSHSGAVCVESDGMNGERYVIIPKKCWELLFAVWWRHLVDCIHLLRVWMGSIGIIYCSEECDWVLLDFTLLSVEDESHVHRLCAWSCAGSCHGLHHLFHGWWHHLRFLWLPHSIPESGPSSVERYPGHMMGPRGSVWTYTFPMVLNVVSRDDSRNYGEVWWGFINLGKLLASCQ